MVNHLFLGLDVTICALSEAVPLAAADSGRLSILAPCLATQPGGVKPLFGHVQLRGAAISHVGSQFRAPGPRSGPGSGPCPPAPEQGLGPGGLLGKRHSFSQPALLTQRPHQVECGRGLRVYQIAARSDEQTHQNIAFASESWFDCWLTVSPVAIHAGCQEIADEFRSQEIDGQALLLLKEDHLMSTMNIKLGPALKIFARINMLKDS